MREPHLNPDQISSLLFANRQLSQSEMSHVKTCKECNEWLTALATIVADASVDGVVVEVPPLEYSN